MKILFILLLLGAFVFTPVLVSAHPGRTDANGGHYCRTNCAKWGLKNGQYHNHNKVVKAAKIKSKSVSK